MKASSLIFAIFEYIFQVKSFLYSGLKGIVLQTFGSGNLTTSRTDLLRELKNAVDQGLLIVNCTQCYNGNVAEVYETGKVRNCIS